MKIQPIKLIVFLAVLAFFLFSPESATACPTCKSSLHGGTALGYAISILFMMGMPIVIFSFWVVIILRLRANMEFEPRDNDERFKSTTA